MSETQMGMLLSAIKSALICNDCKRAIDFTNVGMTMLYGSEHEREAAWMEIEKLAE